MTYEPRDIAAHSRVDGQGQDASTYSETLRQLAAFHMSHGAMTLAERMTRVALWLDPENPRNWRLRASCLARMNNPREALKLLSRARSEGVTGIGLKDLLVIGFAFARVGHFAEARKFLSSEKS